MTEEHSKNTSKKIIPIPDWPKYHPWPSVAGLRHLIFHAEKNGFNQVIRRSGRRVLIDETAFFIWLEQNGVSARGGTNG